MSAVLTWLHPVIPADAAAVKEHYLKRGAQIRPAKREKWPTLTNADRAALSRKYHRDYYAANKNRLKMLRDKRRKSDAG